MSFSRLIPGASERSHSHLYVCETCGYRQWSMVELECPHRGCYRRWMTLETP